MMRRLDKQPDRVEISPEQLSSGAIEAEALGEKMRRPVQVVGWYHSHPHITVWPSHVGNFECVSDPLLLFPTCTPCPPPPPTRRTNSSKLSVDGSSFCWTHFLVFRRTRQGDRTHPHCLISHAHLEMLH